PDILTTVAFEDARQETSSTWKMQFGSDSAFAKALCDEELSLVQNYKWKDNRRFRASVALSMFADFEDPKAITTRILDGNHEPLLDPKTNQPLAAVQVAPPDERRLRVTVRPGISYRINEIITLDWVTYFKVAADSPRSAVVNGHTV